jgi:hypothetical protein
VSPPAPGASAPTGPGGALAEPPRKASLTPDTVDPARPVPAAELQKAYFAWKGKRVTISGYCKLFFSEGPIGDCDKITGEPDGKQHLITTDFERGEGDPAPLTRATPVVVRGTIEDWMGDDIRLKDCEHVSRGQPPPTMTSVDPQSLDENTVMPATLFHASYFGWRGKEVTVSGVYHSHTTSTTSFGKTIRVDLADDTGFSANKSAACEVPEEPPADVANARNVVMRGKIKGSFFDQVLLDGCVFVR